MSVSLDLLKFIKESPSAFHAVKSISDILDKEGFIHLNEGEKFILEKNKKYYVTRNLSSVIAFKTGENLSSFNIVSSHSDCPSFKVKPRPDLEGKGYSKIEVEGYGGMICSSWFDRPLSLCGRVMVKNKEGEIEPRLIAIDKNLLSIPNVAIHMNREVNSGYKYNLAVDMMPVLSQEKISLYDVLASYLKVNKEDIRLYDLYLYNHSEGYFWGLNDEFISSPKLDDLQCAYTTLLGFISGANKDTVQVYCCFDNEEVGSTTRQGANSSFLEDTLKRIAYAFSLKEEDYLSVLASSFMVSADNAHAVHPNHPEFSDPLNNVFMNKGIVIKHNAAQSYTSDSLSSSIFMEICDKVKVPYQFFNNRSDLRGGGTLGNISASHVSVSSVDIGLPQLAMHSCQESAGTLDNDYMVKAMEEFFSTRIIIDNDGKVKLTK